jgi:hypothetical protein
MDKLRSYASGEKSAGVIVTTEADVDTSLRVVFVGVGNRPNHSDLTVRRTNFGTYDESFKGVCGDERVLHVRESDRDL